ncbi:MAG: hypothetical protein RQ754_05525 [Desulfuromonadales bacterium]|nr:hypothetical protein [Desulfuromonadales bacterium]
MASADGYVRLAGVTCLSDDRLEHERAAGDRFVMLFRMNPSRKE